jgi:CheY-like chemotaxis protein
LSPDRETFFVSKNGFLVLLAATHGVGGHVSTFTFMAMENHPSKKIYLFEDDESLSDIYHTILSGAGYTVRLSNDPKPGFEEEVFVFAPDLVLTDILMPSLDGLTLTRRLKAEPRTASIPVIVLSNYAEKASEALAAGAVRFLPKLECSSKRLLREVREALGLPEA